MDEEQEDAVESEEHSFDMAMLGQAVKYLRTRFDSVQIFASRENPGGQDGTITAEDGAGNWYARYGQAQMWVRGQR